MSEITFFKNQQPTTIMFCNSNNKVLGSLSLGDTISFTGNADESALVFFNHVNKYFYNHKLGLDNGNISS